MKKIKLLVNTFILLIICLGIVNVNIVLAKDEEVTCGDVVKDGYDDINYSAINVGAEFSGMANQITDEHFVDFYKFYVEGVDIQKIKDNGLEEEYIKALKKIKTKMENAQGANTLSAEGFDVRKALGIKDGKEGDAAWNQEKEKVLNLLTQVEATEKDKQEITQGYDDVNDMQEAGQSTNKQDAVDAVAEATENNEDIDANDKIFKWPEIAEKDESEEGTLKDMIEDGDNFISVGDENKIKIEQLKKLTGNVYNILLEIGVGLSVIIGLVLGIKFMLSGVEEKAQVKKMLWVYVIGCIITFGSFGIWKLVVETTTANLISEEQTSSKENEQEEGKTEDSASKDNQGGTSSNNNQGSSSSNNNQGSNSSTIKVTKIYLNEKSIVLEEGKTEQLKASVAPANATNKKVVWKSSNTSVAKVDNNGKITARKAGTANITVTPVSNSKISATCTVVVKEYKQTATNLLKSLEKFSNRVESDYKNGKYWTYHWVNADTTFEKAISSGRRQGTCVSIVRWGLMDIGALEKNMYYGYTSGTTLKSWNGGGAFLKQYATVTEITSRKTPKQLQGTKNELKPGDIIGWDFHHMSIYAGNKKFYDAGRIGANGCTAEYDSFKTFGPVSYGWNNKVKYIIRLKR